MNKIDPAKYLPSYFTEEDKIEYQLLCDEARRIFKNIKHDFIVETCVLHHMNEQKGMTKKASQEEIDEIKKKYDLSNKSIYETPFDPDYDFESAMKQNLITPNETPQNTQIELEA